MAKITEMQKLFVDEYLKNPDLNQTRAYMKIYKSVKNEATAAVNASRLLSKPHVKEYLKATHGGQGKAHRDYPGQNPT
jgi:phage terminase small subunit